MLGIIDIVQGGMMSRKLILIIGGALFACAVIGVTTAWIFYQQDIAQTQAAYGEEIVMLCNPIRGGGEASEDNLPVSSAPLKAVVFAENQLYVNGWYDDLNPEWQAETKEEVDLVICLRDRTEVVERCEYGGATSFVERIQPLREVHIFNAETRTLITEMTLYGGDPPECPDSIYAEDGETEYQNGSAVTFADFENAIRPYIES
jgi:hypothetical protein